MKNLWTKLSVLAALFTVVGCAEGNSEDEKQPETCTANICKDASTLVLCSQGISTELTCTYGCENGACKPMNQPAGCTVNICKDASTLLACNSGVQSEVPCSFGCEAGACKAPTQNEQCSINVCQNSDILLACNAGIQSIVPCPYGCEKGVCKAACSTDVCKDAATLLMCDNGKTSEVACALGCNAGKCNAACSADFCRDSQILMHCENGNIKPIDCPYGCNAGVCNSNVPVTKVCDNGAKQCDANGNAQECLNNQWVTIPCSNGCTAGTCNPAQTCTSGARQCDANGNAQVCVSNSWQTIPCSNGCSNGNCNAAPTCANGATQCDANGNAQICQNNAWQTSACAKGCKNGACIVCYDNETQCAADGKTIQTCSANTWRNSQVCSVACSAGICVNDTSCSNGAKQCNGNTQQICTNNQWVNGTVCDYACEGGECKAAPSVCTNGQKQCNGNNLQTCNNGQWSTTTCANGCENNACKDAPAVCSNGQTQCNGVYVQTCTNGQWVQATTPCANGCSNGACTNAPADCTGNEKKCSGSNLMTCSNGKWSTTTCANGCDSVNLVCKSSGNLPNVGDSCNESFDNVCNGDTIYYCNTSAKVSTASCAQMNATCRTNSSSSVSDCVELCSASQNRETTGYYCDYYSDYGIYVAYPLVCSATTNGDYAEFIDSNNFNICDGNCNETEGCTDSAYFYCGDKTTGGQTLESICKASSSTSIAVCTTDATGTYYECAQSCSTVGQTGTACTEFSDGVFSYNTTCTQVGDYKVMLDASTSIDDYTECTSGACNAAGTACAGGSTPACSNGSKQCNGNNLLTCTNGQWATTTCQNGCANGACISGGGNNNEGSSTHTLGASCTSAEYGEFGCDGNTLVACDGSTYINVLGGSYTCKDYGSNYYCDEQLEYGWADCVQPCDAEDEGSLVDFSDNCNSGTFELYFCEEGDSGKLGVFGGYYAVSMCYGDNQKIACNSSSVISLQTCNSCQNGYNASYDYEATCR